MSWNASFRDKVALAASIPDYATPSDIALSGHDQYKAARRAAQDLIASGAVGDSTKDFQVNLSGHANPEHKPLDGYANDCITISLTQHS